jgi:hypothetical protein
MSSQNLFTAAGFAFIGGAILLMVYNLAIPIWRLLLIVREQGKYFNLSRTAGGSSMQIADERQLAKWRRTIGIVGAGLCMVASLIFTLASSMELV